MNTLLEEYKKTLKGSDEGKENIFLKLSDSINILIINFNNSINFPIGKMTTEYLKGVLGFWGLH